MTGAAPNRRCAATPGGSASLDRVSTTRIVDVAGLPGAQEAEERAAEIAWRLPPALAPLARIAFDYRWSWDPDGPELFRALDPHAWELNARNPLRQLADLTPHAASIAASHRPTLERIARLAHVLEDDRARPEMPIEGLGGPVVFVCAEFGVHPSLPIYSGGLGALAGDILKAASDLALPVIGVGLLYRKGYFQQRVDRTGLQHEYWTQIMPDRLPTVQVRDESGAPLTLSFPFFEREVAFHVWRAEIGRVPLYLLDAELEENDPVDRWITARLYEGNPLTRLGQYGLLGLGTVRALRALGIEPGVLHFNEGHPALAALELAAEDVAAGAATEDALAAARERCVFTTHTPVPAGNETYETTSFLDAFAGLPASGRDRRGTVPRPLPHASGRRRVARHDAARATALAPRERRQHAPRRGGARDVAPSLRRGGGRRGSHHPRHERGTPAHVPLPAHAGAARPPPRRRLARPRLRPGRLGTGRRHPGRGALGRTQRGQASPRRLRQGQVGAGPAPARRGPRERHGRGGDVRRGHPDARLRAADRHLQAAVPPDIRPRARAAHLRRGPPLQLVVAGKAHPLDDNAKQMLVDVFGLSQSVGITSRVAFLENYDLSVAAPIVGGCDVWLNVPRPPLEASGTSGMKSAANGGLNLSVLDGWWFEGYDGGNGWEIDGDAAPGEDDAAQDARHAHALYDLLEQQVIPLFHDRDADGIPRRWLAMVKHSLRTNGPRFSATRMVEEYASRVYPPG